MPKKFLVFDVDNTITERLRKISDEMALILNSIDDEIAFISGTNVSELKRMVSSKLTRRHHLLGNTGTHYIVIDGKEEKEMLKKTLPKNEKERIIRAIKDLKQRHNLLPMTSEEDQILDRGSQITLSILGRHAPRDKKEGYDPSKKKRLDFVKYLKNLLNDEFEVTIGGTTSIDITEKGINKGDSIIEFMEINGLEKGNVVFFGDQLQKGGNDYSVKVKNIKCIEVSSPSNTIEILKKIYKKKKHV